MRTPYVELHTHSAFGLHGGSTVEALVARAAKLGMPALALTDHMTLAGAVRFQTACATHGVRPILGAELAVADPQFGDRAAPADLVVLAENARGYEQLCTLLTEANLKANLAAPLANPQTPVVPFAALAAALANRRAGLIVLTGGRNGTLARLLLAREYEQAEAVATRYREVFGPEHVFVELQHHLLPDSMSLAGRLARLAETAGLRCVVTNGVRHATREDYPLYDLLTCVRLGISLDEDHLERPANDEASLKGDEEMRSLCASLPGGEGALEMTASIAARCHCSTLRTVCRAPSVPLTSGEMPAARLRTLCEAGLTHRYAGTPAACAPDSIQRRQMEHELAVITKLELEEFFLCVERIVSAAREMGIRISGRGSAANSLVAYLLGITGVDPLQHRLLFERFLNPERQGMPDIDLDVQSDRRDELIRWVEQTWSADHAAMVANVITYRPRLALRDVAKTLGFPMPLVNQLSKVLPHHVASEELGAYRAELARVVERVTDDALRARYLGRLDLALELTGRLIGLPRHLSLHNGGVVLSRAPLAQVGVVRLSANGVRALELNKDDVEQVGLIKFDLLGLRTLGAIEEALALIEETTGTRPDIDALPTDPPDAATMRLVRAGQTLAVFQIESPGQWHLLAQTQPDTFDDIIVQTALFRPGPIIGGFIHPYVARRQGQPVDGEHAFWLTHPVLGTILSDTEGILLFQEHVLQIAARYAGLSYAEADGFRRAISHYRTTGEMEAMRARFVAGAVARGEPSDEATRVFEALAAYTGYGFCKSHAAEFARVIYQTAYLKAHYPAQYLAAFLSAQPAGFFPAHVVLEEAKLLGIPVLAVDANRSEARFSVERVGTEKRFAIRIGLAQVRDVGEELARAILWERRGTMQDAELDGVADTRFGGTHVVWRAAPRAGEMPAVQETRRLIANQGQPLGNPPVGARLVSPGGAARFSNNSARFGMIPWNSYDGAPSEHGDERMVDGTRERAFRSLSDFCTRLRPAGLTWDAAASLALAGAFDSLCRGYNRRQILWRLHELWPLVAPIHTPRRGKWASRTGAREVEQMAQMALEWEPAMDTPGAVPPLPVFDREERAALDYELLGLSARPHPMALLRRSLRRRGILAIAELGRLPAGRTVRVAGWPISAQRPPTAKGMGFLVIEDETGRLPVALPPRLARELHRVIRSSRVLCVVGRLECVDWYRSILAYDLHAAD